MAGKNLAIFYVGLLHGERQLAGRVMSPAAASSFRPESVSFRNPFLFLAKQPGFLASGQILFLVFIKNDIR